MIVSWMLRSMDSKTAARIPLHESAKVLWEYLERQFCVANEPHMQQFKSAIIDCKQTDVMNIDEYYTKLMGLHDEFPRLKPLPSCECKKCECGLALRLSKEREEDIFHQIFIGLDPKYVPVRTNLLSQQPLRELKRAFQVLSKKNTHEPWFVAEKLTKAFKLSMLLLSVGRTGLIELIKAKLFARTINRRDVKLGRVSKYTGMKKILKFVY